MRPGDHQLLVRLLAYFNEAHEDDMDEDEKTHFANTLVAVLKRLPK